MTTKWATPLFLSALSFMVNTQNVCAICRQGQEQSSSRAFQTNFTVKNSSKPTSLTNNKLTNNPIDSLEYLLSKWDTLLNETQQQVKASKEDFQLFSNFNRSYLDSEWAALFQLIKCRKINNRNIASYLDSPRKRLQTLYSNFVQIKLQFPSSLEPFQHPSVAPPLPVGCNPACTNMDFSAGNFTGWSGFYAVNNSTTSAHVFTGITGGSLGPVVRGSRDAATSNTYQVHITSRGNNDWFLRNYHAINMSQASPWGSGYSAMIGDSINNGKGIAVLSQEFQVTPTTNSVTYAYSVFLENPAHNYYQQPFFSVTLFDQNGDTIRNCGVYNVVSGPNIPGFVGEYYPPDNNETSRGAGGDTIYWRPWTQVNVPLNDYVGQCVTVQFEVGDCALGGHCGYAYVDASCSTFTITAASPVICGNGTDVLTGPAGESHYSWTGPANSILTDDTLQRITVDSGGTYTLVITPVTGGLCKDTLTITIPRDLIAVTATATDINCNGGVGSATATATNGMGAYTYSWSPSGGTNATATGLSAGNYTITVADTNGCPVTATVTLTQPSALISSTTILSNETCNGDNNGSAIANVSGGTSPYNYLWNPSGQTNATATGLSALTYTVTVSDAHGCTASSTAVISQPTVLSASTATTSNVSCTGGANGSASVTATGGTSLYNYLWSPSSQTNATATGLSAGTYTVTVTDAHGCTASATAVITQPIVALSASTAILSNVSCTGGANGSASVTASGGTSPYNYLWNPSGQTNATATGLSAGTYTITVTDAHGCTASSTAVITQPFLALSASTATLSNVSCTGGANGSANVTAAGGTSPYSYLWIPSGQTNATATGLTAGTYTITVTDAHGCTASSTAVITQPLLAVSAIATDLFNVSCTGGSNGSASVTASGGTSPYGYLWSPSGQTNATATGLSAGAYIVTVTDVNGCTVSSTTLITEPPVLNASTTTIFNVSCTGGSNGSASVTASGGTSPYNYLWDPSGQTNVTATGLSAGTYTITVTDAHGCTASATAVITQPIVALSASTAILSNVSCTGGSNGSASVTANGGTSPYNYLWSPSGQTNATATGLSAGTYTVTVTDTHGCTASSTAVVSQPLLAVSATATTLSNVSCTGGANGSARAVASGGTSPYNYLWSPSGQTNATATGLSAGTYTVTVTDAHGCRASSTAIIIQPLLAVSAIATTLSNVSCTGGANGSASAGANGGTSPYNYLWSPSGQTNTTATGLSAGTYTVTVTDAHGCRTTATTAIIQPLFALSAITTARSNISCNGNANGSASVIASGGTSPYYYLWNPSGQTNTVATGLSAGTYTVTVTDAHGCNDNRTISITQPLPVSLYIGGSQTPVCKGQPLSISADASGGTLPYVYSWSTGNTTSAITITPFSTEIYTVSVIDANGCSATATITITISSLLATTGQDVPICSGESTNLIVNVSGGSGNYSYKWFPGNDATPSITVTPTTTTTYTVIITDGCSSTDTAYETVVVNPLPNALFRSDINAGCAPLCVQFRNSSTIGSAGSIVQWNWDFGDGANENSESPIHCYTKPGTYDVVLTITSNSGCSSSLTKTKYIKVYGTPAAAFEPNPQPTTISNPVIQFTNQTNDKDSIVSWLWNFGASGDSNTSNAIDPFHRYADTGTYRATLTVMSNHGCTDSVAHDVVIGPNFTLFFPNAFTPNGDGLNEVFFAKGTYVKDFEMYIYDRWGMKLFHTTNINDGWDGKVNGSICQEDVYVYVATASDVSGNTHQFAGRVTLLK